MTTFIHGYYPRIFNGNSTIRNVSTMTPSTAARVFCMRISPDGRFFAIGDEEGTLEIRVLHRGLWRRACLYSTGGAVRTLVWHPTKSGIIFSGSANGALHKITVVIGGTNVLCDALVPGYIHLLQLSRDGQRLVIAHGRSISFVEDPFSQRNNKLGTLLPLDIGPAPTDNSRRSRSLSDHYIPRAIFFLPNDNGTMIVAFLGVRGLRAYSLVNQQFSWSISLRPGSLIGSAAISPSGERIAVMNLVDGIDFYSTSHRRYLSTTRYNISPQVPRQNFIVDLLFVDEDTVAFGHSDGFVGFGTFGVVDAIDRVFEMATTQEIVPVQVITFGLVGNIPLIFALASSNDSATSSIRYCPTIRIGEIVTPGMPHYLPDLRPTSMHFPSPSPPKLTIIIMLATIAVTWFSIAVGQALFPGPGSPNGSAAPSSAIASTHNPCATTTYTDQTNHFSTITSALDPSSTCICTVTGTFDAAQESGII